MGNLKTFNLTRSILYPFFFTGLVYTWFFAEDRLMGCVLSLLAGNGAVVLFRLVAKWDKIKEEVDFSNINTIFKEGIPFQLATVLTLSSQYVDQILLLWILDPLQLGVYIVARSSASVIGSLPTSLGIISLSEATQLDAKSGFLPLAQTLRRGGILTFLLVVGFAPLLHILIPIVYGVRFSEAISLAVMFLCGVVPAGLASVIEQALRGHGLPLAGMYARLSGVLILAVVGGVAASFFGTTGVVLGYVLSQWIVLLLFVRIMFVTFKNGTLKQIIPQVEDFVFLYSYFNKLVLKKNMNKS